MSVAAQLGLDDPGSDLLGLAAARWPVWQGEYQALSGAPSFDGLRQWLASTPLGATDGVLATLARLGTCRGGDDVAAAATLCWVLLPGATSVAISLHRFSPEIDHIVASQLWLEVRSGRPPARKVAVNIILNTRKGVHGQLGLGRPRGNRWDRAVLVDPTSRDWLDFPDPGGPFPASAELGDLLERACLEQVISWDERRLLVRLAEQSDGDAGSRCCNQGGLTSAMATTGVCSELGISERTVRRRVHRSVRALSEAYA